MTDSDVSRQLQLVEEMILEGRRTLEHWGWVFVMWGVAHVIAIVWSGLWTSNPGIPWAILMGGCGLVMMVACIRVGMHSKKSTLMGRAQGAAWASFTISVTILWVGGALTHVFDVENIAVFYAIFFTLIGSAHFTSGLTVKLPVQTMVGILWWIAAALAMFAPSVALWALFGMALIGEISFGLYLMALERKGEAATATAT